MSTTSRLVTCPSCSKSLRSDRPVPPGANLKCPECRTPFTAPEAGRSSIGPAFWIVTASSLVLGGSIIIAAVLMSGGRTQPQPPEDDVAAKKKLDDDARKLADDRKALDTEKAKLEASRLVSKADDLLAAGKHTEAEKLYDEALRLAPGDPAAIAGRVAVKSALAAKEKGDGDTARRDADRARLLADGKAALAGKKYAQAIPLLEAARAIAPTDADVLAALTDAKAGLDADAAEKKKLADYTTRLEAGKIALAGNRFDDAAREFVAALVILPGDAAAAAGLKQADGKLAALADADKLQKQMADLLARARVSKGRTMFKEALEILDRAVRLNPDDKEAARLHRDTQAALKEARTASARLLARANTALNAGMFDDAISIAGDAARAWAEDDSATKLVKKAETLRDAARGAEARFITALAAADLAMNTGRYADAVRGYEAALELQPLNVDIQRALRNARIALDKDLRNKVEYERLVRVGSVALRRQAWAEAKKAFLAAQKYLPADLAAKQGVSEANYGKAMQEGEAALAKNQKAAAIAAFEAALAEKVGDLRAKRGLAQARKLK